MLSEKNKIRVSKFMSLVLRHKPEEVEATLDADGWMPTITLLKGVEKMYPSFGVTLQDIQSIVDECEKQRYTLDEKNNRIRANQGHSVKLKGSTVEEATPPDTLYHGTSWATVGTIMKEGLKPMSRIHVHLSEDQETATKVGIRHCRENAMPAILKVDAKAASENGVVFYRSDNNVWLCEALPKQYIQVMPTGVTGSHC